MEKRCSFELFKSNVCHRLKEQGDIDFLIETLKEDMIRQYYDKKWYPESFYLLAMVDYISRENNVPICNDYDDLRSDIKSKKMLDILCHKWYYNKVASEKRYTTKIILIQLSMK